MIPCLGPTGSPRRIAVLLVVAGALVGVLSCDKVPLTAPTESTITIFANPTTIPLNGSAVITASVIEQAGTPVHNGTLVTFTTTLGSFDQVEARTNGGQASTRLMAGGMSGTASIGAFSGGTSAEAIEVRIGAAAAGRVTLNALPATVPSTGGTVQLVAVVTDTDGNRLPGVPVTFTSSAGVLSAGTVATDANGQATTNLTTDRESTVTATAGNAESQQVTVRVSQAPNIIINTVTSNPTAGQPVVFSIAVTPGTNSSPVREVTVSFGDGASVSLGRLSGTQNVTHVYNEAGSFTVTATVEDTSGERTSVSTVVFVVPVQVNVSLSGPATAVRGTPVIFTVTVSPSTTNVRGYTFDMGDGTVLRSTSSSTTVTQQHTYGNAGTFTVTVTVETTTGQEFRAQTVINVTLN